mmetsp:Transcript_94425/g.131229  ORF Transcript_94425/g.131229 Transcript_94425/m.131229 type:complete len:124 (-) Transcript_94425:16-387(-)|eukprot:s837_g9.t1
MPFGPLKGSTPEDPTDLSPPDELAQALSLWARHSSGAASRGAQAAAYARRQANIATSLAREAAQKILELDTNECVQNYENEFLGPAATESAFSAPLLHLLLAREMSMDPRAACRMNSRLRAFL